MVCGCKGFLSGRSASRQLRMASNFVSCSPSVLQRSRLRERCGPCEEPQLPGGLRGAQPTAYCAEFGQRVQCSLSRRFARSMV